MTSTVSARIFRSLRARFMASRLSISTTPLRRRSRRRCSIALNEVYTTQYANVHRGLHYLANEATEAYELRARKGRALSQRQAQGRDHLHAQRHRGDQPCRLHVRARAHQGRRRDRALDHGAPFQHRAVAFSARAPRRRDQMGTGRRRRQFSARRVRKAARSAHQDGRHHPHVERAGHR